MEKIYLRPEHVEEISKDTAQEISHLDTSHRAWESIVRWGNGFSGVEDGEIYICSGIFPVWTGRWMLWAAISNKTCARHMLWIHRRALEWLNEMQHGHPEKFRRIEATARVDEPQAMRWLEMLGFLREGVLLCYDAAGNDHIQYARISCHLTQDR